METVLCSVPVEIPGTQMRRKRSEGPLPILPKIAITHLNNWAEKNGFPTCKFYDVDMLYPSDEEIEKYFKENKADVVGLSAVVSTSYMQVRRLAQIIKKANKNALIVCGGYLTAAANTVLRKTEVDVCVVGDGEVAWVGILNFMKEHLEKGKNKIDIDKLLEVKGIAVIDDDKKLRFSGYGKRLSDCEMAFPSLDYLKTGLQGDDKAIENYFRPVDRTEMHIMDDRAFDKDRKPMTFNIFLTKGCVAKCTFCQRGAKGYSVYDLKKFEIYLKDLRDNHNVGFIFVADENFGSNKKHAFAVADIMDKYNMLWSIMGVRCGSLSKEDLRYLQKKGLSSASFGIESGSQTMLDIMEKKYTTQDIKDSLFSCIDLDLFVHTTGFMLGMPGESMKTARESGKLMGEIAARFGVPVSYIFAHNDMSYAIPLVGTPLYEYGKQLGLIGQTVDEEEKYLELVSNVGSYKRYYINFNGAPISEVLFWDMLAWLEATRTYEKLMKGKKVNEKWKKRFLRKLEVQGRNPHIYDKQKEVRSMGGSQTTVDRTANQYKITNFLKQHVVFNKKIAKLPRFLVDPFVRYSLYFEFLIQKYFIKEAHNNIHASINAKSKPEIRIKNEEIDPSKTTQKDRSLRTIVAKRMMQLNRSDEDKTLSMLTGGP